jgi:hypothetical protein
MAKSIPVKHKPKKPGRPATGHDPFVGIRLPKSLLTEIHQWSVENEATSRTQAIRRLVEIGLKARK